MSPATKLLLLLAIAAVTAWLAWIKPEIEVAPVDSAGKQPPDYYLTGMTVSHFGPDGRLQQVLKAERMEHTEGVGTELTAPRLSVENPTGSPWQVSGSRGHLSADGTLLTMPDTVEIFRLATPHNRPVRLVTRNLRYRQAEGYAETDEAVTVISDRDRIDAVGLKAWLQAPGHVQLLSQVKAHYEP